MRLSIEKTNDLNKIKKIRTSIFKKELGISDEEIFDNKDKILEQFLVIKDGKPIGSFRLKDENNHYKLERIGILSEYRSRGFGKTTLEEIKKYSNKKNKSKLILDSMYDIRGFYKKSGFVEVGNVFFKAGLPHIKMEMSLNKLEKRV